MRNVPLYAWAEICCALLAAMWWWQEQVLLGRSDAVRSTIATCSLIAAVVMLMGACTATILRYAQLFQPTCCVCLSCCNRGWVTSSYLSVCRILSSCIAIASSLLSGHRQQIGVHADCKRNELFTVPSVFVICSLFYIAEMMEIGAAHGIRLMFCIPVLAALYTAYAEQGSASKPNANMGSNIRHDVLVLDTRDCALAFVGGAFREHLRQRLALREHLVGDCRLLTQSLSCCTYYRLSPDAALGEPTGFGVKCDAKRSGGGGHASLSCFFSRALCVHAWSDVASRLGGGEHVNLRRPPTGFHCAPPTA